MALNIDCAVSADQAEIVFDDGQRVTWRADRPIFSTSNANFALLAALPRAMRQRKALHVRGAVDREMLRNAHLLSHFWAQWRPDLYGSVEIAADAIVDEPAAAAEGDRVVALSGGVDSTYVLLEAATSDAVHNRYSVPLGVFVHGFDYALADVEGYGRMLSTARDIARSIGSDVCSVATDWKPEICDRAGADWRHVHMIGLAAVLHLFGGGHAGALVATDHTFREDHLIAPWGNNTVTSRMLGSRGFPVTPFGDDATRIQKLQAIDRLGQADRVNVCWAGPRTGRNCGRCEKCLRTMLIFEALGIDPTPAFGRRPQPAEVARAWLNSWGKIDAFGQSVDLRGGRLSPSLKVAARAAMLRSHIQMHAGTVTQRLGGLFRRRR